jgi:hypothetical protein
VEHDRAWRNLREHRRQQGLAVRQQGSGLELRHMRQFKI